MKSVGSLKGCAAGGSRKPTHGLSWLMVPGDRCNRRRPQDDARLHGLVPGRGLAYWRHDGLVTQADGDPEDGSVKAARPTGNRSGRAPLVVSLESAGIRKLDHLPEIGWLHRAMVGRVHVQGLMNPPPVVEVDVASHNPAQVVLVADSQNKGPNYS